ncbi:hypothetical protein OPV22_018727 [Ensete ventricosum]|uniref:BZIP domain-containing protein n=1 Tax=Ensete ventricosum TaxID=4639 RepID=A0AAV8QUV5_ENSVE|nr:hypothetical protein OPV22_018727 [Ensete ventricosum]
MASPGGTSSGSSLLQSSGSDQDLQAVAVAEQKKRQRMKSNRESARRSRIRKQKHLDDLTAEANQLRQENSRLLTSLFLTTQHHVAVEAENSVLSTRMLELTDRLQSLDEILLCFSGCTGRHQIHGASSPTLTSPSWLQQTTCFSIDS